MDKILLTAFLSSLAGFITAILSIVKLVNEKESKTSEYRQAWTDSVRKCLSDLIGLINAYAANIASGKNISEHLDTLVKMKEGEFNAAVRDKAIDHSVAGLEDRQVASREMIREIYKTYALTRLHFKPDDLSFSRIEQNFSIIMSQLDELKNSDSKDRIAALKEKIHSSADEITSFSRSILKTEWETVKKGENAYQLTKRWSIAGSVIMMFIIVSIGIHAIISMWKQEIKDQQPSSIDASAINRTYAPHQTQAPGSMANNLENTKPASIQISNVATCSDVLSNPEARKLSESIAKRSTSAQCNQIPPK